MAIELDIPHGHGLAFKKGIADGLLDKEHYKDKVDNTHKATYRRGVAEGEALKAAIAARVR